MMRNLRSDRRGNVAILLGLLAVPLIGLAGLAIDFGSASMARAKLDLAADSAALLATTVASNAYLNNQADPIGAAQAAAAQRFLAQAAAQQGVTIGKVTVAVHQTGASFEADIAYAGSLQTTLGQVVGVSTIGLHGQSSSSQSLSPYIDIEVLMDVSSSMTIAATTDAISKLQLLTASFVPSGPVPSNVVRGEACGFACHWATSGVDYYALARLNAVPLRLDILRSAVGNLVTSVATLDTHATYRLGLYVFAQAFQQIFPLNSQIASANAALAQIAPDTNDCSSNCPETYFASAMNNLASITTSSGNGASQATAQKYVFIVSDGLVDQYSGNDRIISPVSAASCAALKAKGATILVLYTAYLPLPNNGFYNQYVAPIQSQIAPGLQACASSPNLFFQANSAADVDTELQRLLQTALQTSGHFIR